jgi:hypothetical protein
MDAVKRCEELLASAVELNAKRGGQKPEELYEIVYLENEDVVAVRQILAERAALLKACKAVMSSEAAMPFGLCRLMITAIEDAEREEA